jgi:hypothetical protein
MGGEGTNEGEKALMGGEGTNGGKKAPMGGEKGERALMGERKRRRY